jgi:hypothetical protein
MVLRRAGGWFFVVVVLWCWSPQTGWGWGRDGHSVVGKIAELRLSDEARAALAELTDRSLADVQISSWPDTITHLNTFPLNAFWHYVDIPYDADDFDPQREAEAVAKRVQKTAEEIGTKNNVIDQIDYWKGVLANPKETRYKRYTALRFLVHFLGDIHQPLHCITRGDAGGNGVPVIFLGHYDPHVKLHQVWDNSLVNFARGKITVESYAAKLNQRITDQNQAEWRSDMAARAWARESHALGKKYAYPPVLEQKWDEHKDEAVKLDMDYAQRALPVVETQLMKAGVRLASLLEEALAPKDGGK